jgi:hypothetical protein
MNTPAPDLSFQFSPTQQMHDTRTRRIRALLRPESPPDVPAGAYGAADYCLAHHALEGAEAAARAGNTGTLNWYRDHPDASGTALFTATAAGPRVIVAPDTAKMPRSEISETPYYVLGPATSSAPACLQDLTAEALSVGAETGFSELLSDHAIVVCLLRSKRLEDTLDSWTITRLPETIFCDYTGHAIVLARDIIHEAGHNWLNDALKATRCAISDEIRFFSPWKNDFRPAFGFIHACWAFPLTMLFTAQVIGRAPGEVRQFLTAYLDKQAPLLATTAEDHNEAMSLIEDTSLRHRLHAIYQQARGL